MTLTQDDLQAIKGIIDGAIEESDQRTAAAFAEVHEKFDSVDQRFENIDQQFDAVRTDLHRMENKLDATVEQVENHETRITKLEPASTAA